jgi:hypothetical protein
LDKASITGLTGRVGIVGVTHMAGRAHANKRSSQEPNRSLQFSNSTFSPSKTEFAIRLEATS